MTKAEKQKVDDYIINRFTMAIIPDEDTLHTKVLEFEQELVVTKRPMEVIDQSCRYFSSSYMGRKEGTRDLMRVTHKPPIVVDPANSIYFFPTTSPTRPHCAWLSHSYVKEYCGTKGDNTIVTFSNNKKMTLPLSVGSFENQLFRTAQLRTIISSRIEQEQRKINMLLFPKGEKEVSAFYEQIIREMNRF